MENLSKRELIKEIIEDVKNELSDEEIIRLILDKKVTMKKEALEQDTVGQKAADKLARTAGSWGFVIAFVTILIVWIIVNVNIMEKAFDPYPFILLNLVLSCLAAIQAPLIIMSQNRREEKDRRRAENDYRVNLKTEIIIQDLYDKIDIVIDSQPKALTPEDTQ